MQFRKVIWICFLSVFCLLAAFPVQKSLAHEVVPSVADLSVNNDLVEVNIRFTAEGLLAGIDLSQVADTNDAEQAEDYDTYRAMEPEQLVQEFRALWPAISADIIVKQDDEVIDLALDTLSVDEVGNTEVGRYSYLTLSGNLQNDQDLTFQWPAEFGSIIIRQVGVDDPVTSYVQNGATSDPIPVGNGVKKSWLEVFVDYIPVGFDHIVPKGLDHILFVLGLFFLGAGLGALVWQVSAFTLAHTVTLALGALGLVVVPASIVEPLIAASIVFVALENVFFRGLSRWRPVVIFGFGLLHGLGFASVLGEFGLPSGQFVPALIGFNIGVEIGQLTVLAVAGMLLVLPFGKKTWYRSAIATPASILIACVGAYWFVERVFL